MFRRTSQGFKALCMGMALSICYYAILLQPFMHNSALHAYTSHHPVEYVIVFCFLWANSELFFAYRRILRERKHAKESWLPDYERTESADNADALLHRLGDEFYRLKDTHIFRRLKLALTFISKRKSTNGLSEYLESLSSRSRDEVHESYSVSRFVIAILPILGLIGTVIHFGIALSGLSMDGLDQKIPSLLSGIGTAFNTTFTAMSCMALTLFCRFLIERMELNAVKDVDAYIETNLLYRFNAAEEASSPFLSLLQASNYALVESLHNFEEKRGQAWAERTDAIQASWKSFEHMREKQWSEFLLILARHQQKQMQEFEQFGENLQKARELIGDVVQLMTGKESLIELQENLSNNIALLRESQQLESAVHELTAAIHLLTARAPSKSIGRNAA